MLDPYRWRFPNLPKPRISNFRKPSNQTLYKYVYGQFQGMGNQQARYGDDPIIGELLKKNNVNTDVLRQWYTLVPPDDTFVYTDVEKYYSTEKDDGEWLKKDWATAAQILAQNYKTIVRNPQILTYQQVKELMARNRSPTTFFAPVYKNKGELFDDPAFERSYYEYVRMAINQTVDHVFQAALKIEMRPTEKVKAGKARAFIIAPIYHLILDHCLMQDFDIQVQEGWFKNDCGIGMSLFGGDYHRKFQKIEQFNPEGEDIIIAYYDVGGYDKKMRYYVSKLEADVVNSMYARRYVHISALIPREYLYEEELELYVDTFKLRIWINYQQVCPFVRMPDGLLVRRFCGESSGNGRTAPRNSSNHKMIGYLGGVEAGIKTHEQARRKFILDVTGDDSFFKGPRAVFLGTIGVFRAMGFEVDYKICKKIEEINYLSTYPVKVLVNGIHYWVPRVEPTKILSSLLMKSAGIYHEINLQRLLAARVLLRYSEANELTQSLLEQYHAKFEREILNEGIEAGKFFWSDEYVDRFYTCSPEALEFDFSPSAIADLQSVCEQLLSGVLE